jgi:hypothetical protein
MAYAEEVLSFEDAIKALGQKTKHVLLGNGFSIACDPIFSYSSLYDAAVSMGLSDRAQSVFQRLGTSNFEAVLRLLEDADWVARTYGLLAGEGSELLTDAEVIKRTLVEAVAKSHLEHTGKVSDEKKAAALAFLRPFKNVFTTNYDLLAYWVNLAAPGGPPWGDGFREDKNEPDAEYVVFSERLGSQPGLFYLHGGLHLFVEAGELKKHCWCRTGKPLTQSIRDGLDQDRYPVFVAEGTAAQKLEHIQRSGYLWYCLDKFSRVESPLVVFGHTLGESDGHIADAIARNMKLPVIAVGLFGDPKSTTNQNTYASAMQLKGVREELLGKGQKGVELSVLFFDSETAKVWGPGA